MAPKNFKVAGEPNTILIPFSQFLADQSEEETFKQIVEVVFHNMGWGYTCFVSSFALFVSEKEINCQTSAVLKAFSSIKSLEAFKQLKMPVIKETDGTDKDPATEGTAYVPKNVAFEIDLRQ